MSKESLDALEKLKRRRNSAEVSLSTVLIGLKISPSQRLSLVGKGISRLDRVPSEHSETKARNFAG